MIDKNGLRNGEAANTDRSWASTGQTNPKGEATVVDVVEVDDVEVEVEVTDPVP